MTVHISPYQLAAVALFACNVFAFQSTPDEGSSLCPRVFDVLSSPTPQSALVEVESSIPEDPSPGLALIQKRAAAIHVKDVNELETGFMTVLSHQASLITHADDRGQHKEGTSPLIRSSEGKNDEWSRLLDWVKNNRWWAWVNMPQQLSAAIIGVDTQIVKEVPSPVLTLGYCLSEERMTMVILACVVAVIYPVLRYRVRSVSVQEGARSCCLLCQIVNFVAFTIVVAQSVNVSNMIGGGVVYSGALIGFFMAGSGLGFVASWLLLGRFPDLWRTHTFCVQCTAVLFGVLGAAMYALICFLVPLGVPIPFFVCRVLLILARILSGVGQGFCSMFTRIMIIRLTPPEDRIEQSKRYQFCTALGMGLGPMFAAGALLGVPSDAPPPIGMQNVAVLGTGTQIIALLCIVLLLPAVDKCIDQVAIQDDGQDGVTPGNYPVDPASWQKKRIVVTCMFCLTLRSYVESGTESLTTLALVLRYGWTTIESGFSVSCTYLMSIPVFLFASSIQDAVSPSSLTLGIIIIQLCSTCLLYPLNFLRSGWFLLISDCITFPLIALGDGIIIGQMDMYKFPEGTLFDANNRTLISVLFTNLLACLSGPVASRWIFIVSGLFGYAIMQSCCLLICLLAFLSMYKGFGQVELRPVDDQKKMCSSSPPWSGARANSLASAPTSAGTGLILQSESESSSEARI